jgi:hypothetical protein
VGLCAGGFVVWLGITGSLSPVFTEFAYAATNFGMRIRL